MAEEEKRKPKRTIHRRICMVFVDEVEKISKYTGVEPQVWKTIRKERKKEEAENKSSHERELERLKSESKKEHNAVRGLLESREKLKYKDPAVTLRRQ